MTTRKNPQLFENYEIGDSIGRGRFAEVFRAIKKDLGREVALKILLPEWYENATVQGQFMEQAKLIARLRHPRIVEALDLGDENGNLYMAMEFLPMGDLHKWLQSQNKKRPSLLQVVMLVEDVAAALDFIHSQKVQEEPMVHGDVKPGNILLIEERDFPGRLRAKLSDLGLLTVLQRAVTMSGSSLFPQSSPLYISPEQANDQPPTPYSDQYALGVVTYELLTGKPPFSGGSDVTIYRQHKQTPPQPPSAINPALQREIDEVLLRILAKEPSSRYQNCTSFARALRQAVEIAEQKRFDSLLEEARTALAEGQPEKALPALETARQIKPEDAEIKSLFEQAQKTALAARSYQEASDLLDAARAEAKKLRAEAPDLSDSQKLLEHFAPRPPAWWQVLLSKWKRALQFAAGLVLFASLGSINYAATNNSGDSNFQTQVAPFWTASPTYTSTNTPTATHTLTPTFTFTPSPTFTPSSTPTPHSIDFANVSNLTLLHRLDGVDADTRIWSIDFSSDGDLMAASTGNGNIYIWSTNRWEIITILEISSAVTSIDFSPDGKWLASGSFDQTVRIWKVNDWEQNYRILQGHNDNVYTVKFSPDSSILASGSSKNVILWDVRNWQIHRSINDFNNWVLSMDFSPSGDLLAVGTMQRISLRSTSTWEEVESVFLPGSWVWSVDFSPDGLWLTASSSHKDIQVWRTSDWKASYIINGFGVSIERAIFSPNGDLVIKLEGDTIRLWDFARQEQMGDPLTGHTSTVSNIAFSPDRWWLASGTTNGEVFLWGIPRWNTARTPTPDPVRTPTP